MHTRGVLMRPRIFTGREKRSGRHMKRAALPTVKPSLRLTRFHGARLSRRGENSPQGSFRRLRVCLRCRLLAPRKEGNGSTRWCRNINRLPFQGTWHLDEKCHPFCNAAFACLLGPTDPGRNALHQEPFPTSVFKVPI